MRDALCTFTKQWHVHEAHWPVGNFLAKKSESTQFFPTFCVNVAVFSGAYLLNEF
jgi:hypothetical protein